MMSEWCIWKDVEENCRGLILILYPRISLETKETHKKPVKVTGLRD